MRDEPGRRHRARLALSLLIAVCAVQCTSHRYRSTMIPAGLAGPQPEIRDDHALDIDAERIALTKAYFAVHHAALHQTMPEPPTLASITFDPRLVVVHFTAIPTLEETLAVFAPTRIDGDRAMVARNGALNVGIQFIVDRDGTIYRSYPETVMSRHVIGLNHVAIGIENVGEADLNAREPGKRALTEAQLEANVALIRYLAGTYPSLRFVIGHMEYRELESPQHPAHELFHEDVADYRTEKVDPGPRFMRVLRRKLMR